MTTTPVPPAPTGFAGDVVLPEGAGVLEGPWDCGFWTVVPGEVRSKSNYRHKGKTRWSDITGFEDRVFASVRAARPRSWAPEVPGTALGSRRPVVVVLVGRATLDTGNLSKSVLDACEGLLFTTDAQVRTCVETVHRTTSAPGLLAAFAQLGEGAGALEALHAGTALSGHVLDLLGQDTPTDPTTVGAGTVAGLG